MDDRPQSPFYHPFEGWVGNKIGYNLFTTRDPAFHAALKQPVAAAYGIKAAVEFEPIVDECIETMVRRLDEKMVQSKEKKACDLAAWMQYCPFLAPPPDQTLLVRANRLTRFLRRDGHHDLRQGIRLP